MKAAHDLAVVGGGAVGCAFALAATRAGLKVLLVDRDRVTAPSIRDPVDLRVSALSPASERILTALGVWPEIAAVRASPYRRMEIRDMGGSGELNFESAEAGGPYLGHIVENRLMVGVMRAQMSHNARISLRIPATVAAFEVGDDGVGIELNDGSVEYARMIVGADGGRSPIREGAGIPTKTWDYRQRAVVTHVSTRKPHQQRCFQRFLTNGPLAFLPLLDGRSSIVWSTTPEDADRLLSMEDDEFSMALEEASDRHFGHITRPTERASFPLHYMHARRYVDERLALVGDAAHVVHPLAGQGVNLGLMDAAALAEVVVDSHRQKRDFWRVSELRRYERWRKGDNLIMANVLHALKYMFGTDERTAAFSRNIGMNLVEEIRPIKKLFMRHAAGMTGDLPRLAVGKTL